MTDPGRRIVKALAEGRLPSAKDRTWLAKQLKADQADKPDALRRRDELLRSLADRHFAGLGVTRKSEEIARIARRYEATAWRREKNRDEPPAERRGTPEELLFAARKLGPIPGPRRLQTIVATEKCSETESPRDFRKSGVQ